MNEFKTYHPIVNFIYFIFVIGFSMVFMHPVCLGISLLSGFVYSVLLKGKKVIKENLIYMLPMMIVMALINPAFNHEGMTILYYFPNGNPLTLESVIYGFSAAVMIACVICWFSCYNKVMTSDKFIYLFGKVIPSLSLILSMTLRFVPKFIAQVKVVANAQRCIGRDISNGGVIKRIRNGVSILSIMITWAMENAIETADSMKSRGYGLKGRTAFSIFSFDKRDKLTFFGILTLGVYILLGATMGKMSFSFFPVMIMSEISFFDASCFIAYFALCILPVMIEFREVKRWKAIKSKI